MPNHNAEPARSDQERQFLDAIDRLLAGKPSDKTLRARAVAGRPIPLTKSNVAREAGYARTYLYKNREALTRVWARLDLEVSDVKHPPSAADIIRTLREQNAKLRTERDLAIDAARRCMQETIRAREDNSGTKAKVRLESEVKTLKARVSQLEAELANLQSGAGAANVVPFQQ